ncbi:hypothetical protein F4861DRAFT_489374 [Xylaria intraflava]|nr:hypothetical protein F4861DRAFT_489374 [Xylaria intraflava]
MSLNGLDDSKIQAAHDAANAEPGGWFLLNYASRDEIEILDTGNGGLPDIRSAIEKYEEPSPLYGFLRYRRRSVIIKYIPENCSRLIQARAAVHFNAICERFTHNTTFEISEAKDLGDRRLSAACSLHAASGSTSSSTSSLHRQMLNEIAEEEEEEERERKRQSIANEEKRPTSSIYSDSHIGPSSPEPSIVLDAQQATISREASFASTKNLPDFPSTAVPLSPTKSDFSRRMSSQSARTEVYSSASYTQGRKVKLGPRPSLETHKKPTAENFRPIAALPAGFKFFKGSNKGKSQEQEQSEESDYTPPASAVELDLLRASNEQLPPRPATSSGASMKSPMLAMASAREGKITPEKARLMKAMKLREKKLQEAKLALSSPTQHMHPREHISEEAAPNANSEKSLLTQPDSSSNADSAIDVPNSVTMKPEPHSSDVALDSHPSSPGAASSTGIGDSTKASSFSELTDETIQALKELPQVTDEVVKAGTAEHSDNAEEASLQKGVLDSQQNTATASAHTLRSETINTDVSISNSRKGAEEFAQIPKDTQDTQNTQNSFQNTGGMNRNSVEATLEGRNFEEAPIQEAVSVLQGSGDSNSGGDKAKPNISAHRPNDPSRNEKNSVSTLSLGVTPSKSTSSEESKSSTLPISRATSSLVSKFSGQDIGAPAKAVIPTCERIVVTAPIPEHEVSKRHAPVNPSPEISVASPPKSRQKVTVEPIHTDLPAHAASQFEAIDPLDDDALMDELQTATVQEAKPITVSKSPITPVFPNPSSPQRKDATLPRAASNPMRGSHLMPVDVPQGNTTRSFSSELSRQPSNASTASKKGNVGSSISQRIKALEALSGHPNDDRPRPSTPSATFFGVRKQNRKEPSRAASIIDRAESRASRSETPRDPAGDDAPTEKRERSSSVASRLSMFEGQNTQGTARVSRGPTAPVKSGSAATPDQRQPTMLVDIQRAQAMTPQPLSGQSSPVVDRPTTGVLEAQEPTSSSDSVSKQATRRSSLSLMKNFIKEHTHLNKSTESPAVGSPKSPSRPSSSQQSVSFPRRLSASSRRSSFNHEGDSASITGVTRSSSRLSDNGSVAEDDKSLSDKKSKNRTSRFMRRLSNSLTGARKSGSASISPTLKEEDADQLDKAATNPAKPKVSSPTIVAFMGDVNVQFPDNLLWKRRSMCLDAQGFLFLSSVQGAAKKAKDSVGTKRFHLGDFRKPYIPDVEVQELPNSVVLDFLEGSSLQIACGDRIAQQEVLRTLQEAHQTHAATGN